MVENIEPFGLVLLMMAGVITVALLSNRISALLRIPAPVIFLLAGAAASDLVPVLGRLSLVTVQQVVTVALVLILFDGGAGIGVRKLRTALTPVLTLGVFGTLLTAAAVATLAHVLFGFSWPLALLLGAALAPTDPAVVFSVLGNREVGGRAGVIIEGESGANDPVGIALLLSLLAVGENLEAGAAWSVALTFAEQMAVGLVVGIAGGWLLVTAMQRMPLPSEGLYTLRPVAGAIAIYGVATIAHGSGHRALLPDRLALGAEPGSDVVFLVAQVAADAASSGPDAAGAPVVEGLVGDAEVVGDVVHAPQPVARGVHRCCLPTSWEVVG
jgi:cell volume regulation protein A